MRKIAILSFLVLTAVLAFYAARTLPNYFETFDIKHSRTLTTKPSFERKKELVLDESILEEVALPPENNKTKKNEEVAPQTEEQDDPAKDVDDYAVAKLLLNNGNHRDFLSLIEKKKGQLDFKSLEGKPWLALVMDYARKNSDYEQLFLIYCFDPTVFEQDEEASLLLGKALIDSGRDPLYWALRKGWQNRSQKETSWLVLDADAYFFQGRRDEAVNVLSSKEFVSKEDVPRLYRLALLHVAENPKKAFEWLTQAKKLDPDNIEVLSYRAKMLEMAGKNDLAFNDYYAAWTVNPTDPKTIAQMTDFYFRQKDFPKALDILSASINEIQDPQLVIKALFLAKVVKPAKLNKVLDNRGGLVLGPYIQYLANLRPWEFWDESYFERLGTPSHQILETEQSAYWLRLLSFLRNDEKQEAWDLLKENPFINQSWNPELEVTIKEILAYQLYGSLGLKNKEISLSKGEIKARESLAKMANDSFMKRINAYSLSSEEDPYIHLGQEEKDLLSGNLSYIAALLELEWTEGALVIYNENERTKIPGWLSLALAKGYENNRNLSRMLEFASRQPESAALNLFIAESLIQAGKIEPALKKLNEIKNEEGEIATEAAWLRALTLIERGEYARARAEIQLNAALDQSLKGKELLAKAALLEGKADLAEEIYGEIAGDSFEGKSYLARRHFENGNFALSKRLTLELLEKDPHNELLRQNMILIEKADKGR